MKKISKRVFKKYLELLVADFTVKLKLIEVTTVS
jgi:ribosomal protein S17E